MKPEQKKHITFILAHPDDEAIPFGLPFGLSRRGHTVELVSLTDGSLGSHKITNRRKIANIRKHEFTKSAAVLGANSHILGARDGQLSPNDKRLQKKLLKHLRQTKPDIILIPHHSDYHTDHTAAHQLAKWAVFHLPDGSLISRSRWGKKIPAVTKSIAVYEADTQGSQTWLSTQEDTGVNSDHLSTVNMILPITSEEIEKSLEAFFQHQSQLEPREGKLNYPDLAKMGAKRRGQQKGFSYGVGLNFIPFGGYAFSTENTLAEIVNETAS